MIKSEKRKYLLLFPAGLLLFLLFFPLDWGLHLPGEISFREQTLLTARENGFLLHYPRNASKQFAPGEKIYESVNPLLGFSILRLHEMIRQDQIVYEQQRAERSTIGDSLLTRRKLEGDLDAMAELKRKVSGGSGTAEKSSFFIPQLGNVSRNFRVVSGMVMGILYSGNKVVRAYADDRSIRDIRPGQHAEIFLRDQLFPIPGKVLHIDPIPAKIRNSAVLQTFGGTIPAVPDENIPNRADSTENFYTVLIAPDQPPAVQIGRFADVRLSARQSLIRKIWQFSVSAFKRELL